MKQLRCTECETSITIDVVVNYCPCCGVSHGIIGWDNE